MFTATQRKIPANYKHTMYLKANKSRALENVTVNIVIRTFVLEDFTIKLTHT